MRTHHRDNDRTDDETEGRRDADDGFLIETSDDRRALAAHAGIGRISFTSVVAGMFVGFGAFGLIAAIAAAIAQTTGADVDVTAGDWRTYGVGAGIAAALVSLLAWFYGGYVAGRMARRSGAANGALSAVLGVVVIVVVGAVVTGTAGDAASRATSSLRSFGIPTDSAEWRSVGTIAGLGTLLTMLLGSLFGGIVGERWHTKLLSRALDPDIGTEAAARDDIARSQERIRDRQVGVGEARDDSLTRVGRARGIDTTGTTDDASSDDSTSTTNDTVDLAAVERGLEAKRAREDTARKTKGTSRRVRR